jgi:CRISPR/Cas system-associated exonuclease Cas4 (RecB family)
MNTMTTSSPPMLSKSRFVAGLQCPGRLYRQCFQPDLATPPDVATRARFAAGTRVGELARELWPDGRLIGEPAFQHDRAVAHTASMLRRRESIPLFEAAFIADDVRIRVDVLNPLPGGGWELIEVKASTAVRDDHIPDIGIQLYVLERAGLEVRRASLAHINRDYVYRGGDYDVEALFVIEDLTGEARDFAATVPDHLAEMRAGLASGIVPVPDPGPFCEHPHHCEFTEFCSERVPEWSIDQLPRLSDELRSRIRDAGVRTIQQIPPSIELSDQQERVRRSVVRSAPFVGPGLGHTLDHLVAPAHFIDFESMNPTLPVYPGTRPYQVLPFQWSDHVLDADGKITHAMHLADGRHDPRREFAESLIEQLSGAATIVVYSGFEDACLRELADDFPDLAPRLQAVRAMRWIDLLELVRDEYYHPRFHGSFSIKSVLPALVPGLGYDDLRIRGGEAASVAFQELMSTDTPEWRRTWLRKQLTAYCARDSVAMVEIVRALRKAAG